MSLTINQKPLYKLIPASSSVIYTVEDTNAIINKFKVKYVADIHILGNDTNALTVNNIVNTVKVSPNSSGVGIIDLKSILSSHVDSQRINSTEGSGSTYKTSSDSHSIHLIDEQARDESGVYWYKVKFRVEYSESASGVVSDSGQAVEDDSRLIYNGFLKNTDIIQQSGLDYGYDLDSNFYIMNNANAKFLTDMPTELYAKRGDYGTASFFSFMTSSNSSFIVGSGSATDNKVSSIKFDCYSNSVGLGVINQSIDFSSGFQTTQSENRDVKRGFIGIYPANLRSNSTFNAFVDDLKYYTVQAFDDSGVAISKLYTVNIIEDDCKGFEGIRLAWLNQLGAWDYYTFNKKSSRTIDAKRQNYTQHSGTWNGSSYDMNNSIGGNRSYNVSSKESITMTTDYITEEDGIFLEGLTISPEVYLINSYDVNDNKGIVNKYVEPVLITSNNMLRKTKANDKLIMHSFSIEKSKSTNTQIL